MHFQLHGWKVYLTDESYAGYYVSYIADAFINAKDEVYYNLAGVAINDPIIGDGIIQQEGETIQSFHIVSGIVVIAPYV